jgi:D-alanyl-D-alanine carboxypeptidase
MSCAVGVLRRLGRIVSIQARRRFIGVDLPFGDNPLRGRWMATTLGLSKRHSPNWTRMKPITRCFVMLLLASIPMRLAHAQLPAGPVRPTEAELAARIDSVVRADILSRGFPSVSIVIAREGKTLLDRAWGMANVEAGQKADASTTYRIASMSKQFTAALVLKLVDRGKLSLTDSIGRHLTGLRPEWKAITVEQLLNHTAGLPRDFLDIARVTENLSGDELIAMAARDTLVTKPGTVSAYSNTGYMFLGVLVEKLYGKPYSTVLKEEIAKPLGLSSLAQCGTESKGHAAAGYVRSGDAKLGPPREQHLSQSLGAGGICSTARDIAKWNQALHGGRVLSAASYAAMTTPRGASKSYGFGLVVRKSPWGSPALLHDGQVHGFSSHNGWYPAESLSVTLLYNARPRLDDVAMADFIGLIALGGTPKPIPAPPVIELPVAATQGGGRPPFVGAYELTIGRVFIVTFEEGTLYVTPTGAARQQLFPKSGTTYALGSPESTTTVTFNLDAGEVVSFTATQNGVPRELRKLK